MHHAVDQAIVLAASRRGRRAIGRVGVQRLAALGDVQKLRQRLRVVCCCRRHRVVADEAVFDVGVDVVLIAEVRPVVLLRPVGLAIPMRCLLAGQFRLAVRKRFQSGEIYIDDSLQHRHFADELVSLDEKPAVLSQMDIPFLRLPIDDQIEPPRLSWRLFGLSQAACRA